MFVGKNSQELIKYIFGINSIAVSIILMKVTACSGLHLTLLDSCKTHEIISQTF